MEIANARLVLNKFGSDTPLKDITPAEAMFLHILHGPSNGGKTFGEEFDKIQIVGTAKVEVSPAIIEPMVPARGTPGNPGYAPEVPAKVVKAAVLRDRTDAEELSRLVGKYNGARDKKNEPIINSIWPDRFNPKLPQTFKELDFPKIGATAAGIETAPVNYATGTLATATLPSK